VAANNEVTIVTLFGQIEALRVLMKMSIDEMAFEVDVTPLAYKNWKNHGAIPQSDREPEFRLCIKRLENRYKKQTLDL